MSGEDVIPAWQGGIKDENGVLIPYKYKKMNEAQRVQMFTGKVSNGDERKKKALKYLPSSLTRRL